MSQEAYFPHHRAQEKPASKFLAAVLPCVLPCFCMFLHPWLIKSETQSNHPVGVDGPSLSLPPLLQFYNLLETLLFKALCISRKTQNVETFLISLKKFSTDSRVPRAFIMNEQIIKCLLGIY